MPKTLTNIERKILDEVQHGLPQTAKPYKDIASKLGIEVEEVLEILRNWKNDGRIRRIGAIVNHFKVGLQAGAMVVWHVPEDRIEEIGKDLASFKEVSHAYERPASEQWPYNLYTMVHGQSGDELNDTIAKMSSKVGVINYKLLETVKELKKVPPTYILDK